MMTVCTMGVPDPIKLFVYLCGVKVHTTAGKGHAFMLIVLLFCPSET